jgi:amidase
MGSIRVPAASCGLFGIKPGQGLVPAELGPNSWFGVAENGPLATTVEDAALMLSVLADRPDLARIEPRRDLRIAVAVGSPVAFWRTDPHWVRATNEIAALLNDLGHSTAVCRLYYPVAAPIARWLAGPAIDARGLDRRLLQRRTRTHVAVGGLALRGRLVDDNRVARAESRVRRQLEGFDAVLTPALAHPPPDANARSTQSWPVNAYQDMHYAPYSAQWNVFRWPAASIPAGRHPYSGTPTAVQIAARPGQEALILSIAAQIQQHRPWPRVSPGR